MKPLNESWMVLIEITNHCWKNCLYCSRFSKHIRKDQRFHMPLEQIEQSIKSYEGFPRFIGIIGGEPTLHPQFKQVCELLLDYYPPSKYSLLTTGGKAYERHLPTIKKTFHGFVSYNEHSEEQNKVCKHQPSTLAIDDVVKDEVIKKNLIDNCWVQLYWCPTIGVKGAFFCEVAYALDTILDGPGGYDIEPGWWKKDPKDFQDQVERYCGRCGMPVPCERQVVGSKKELISKGNYDLYKKLKLPCMSDKDVELFDEVFTEEEIKKSVLKWDPRHYRQDQCGDGTLYHYEKGGGFKSDI